MSFRLNIKSNKNEERMQVLGTIKEASVFNTSLQEALEEAIKNEVNNKFDSDKLKSEISTFICKFRQKYKKHRRTIARVIERENDQLNGEFNCLDKSERNSNVVCTSGRSKINWDNASYKTKIKKS